MNRRHLCAAFFATALLSIICFFCHTQTRGFRLRFILSNLPNDPRWELPSLSSQEQEKNLKLLNQNFTFLGSGGWCYAFLGEDHTTVLKFYKHTHLDFCSILKEPSLEKLRFHSTPWPQGQPYFQEFNFSSCALLYTKAKERTGLLYAHLNKTEDLLPSVTLVDPIGVQHTIDLNHTEFVLQSKAELVIPHLNTLVKQGQIDAAKSAIKDILCCLNELYSKGIRDVDSSFRNNFGYVEGRAITLDLSSFIWDPALQGKHDYAQDIQTKTKRLAHYLKKYQPQLYSYYQECLNTLSLGNAL